MVSTEKLATFFSYISNPLRLELLNLLRDGFEYRNSKLAKMLNISAQECLRHLARLSEAGLVEQQKKYYVIAPLGTILLEGYFPQISFLIKHKEFFQIHDLTVFPPEFIQRLSEVADSKNTVIINGPSEIIALAEQLIEESELFCYDIAKLVTRSTNQLIAQKNDERIDIKRIEEKGSKLPKSIPNILNGEVRIIDHIDIGMVITEKGAYIRIPEKATGEVSLNNALHSSNKNFINFAKDLFGYYWEQAMNKDD